MLRLSKYRFPRWNPHQKPNNFDQMGNSHNGLWDRANTTMKPSDSDEHMYGKGGRIRGHMFSNADGKTTLSGKFSYHHIPNKIKRMDEELVTEMWLSRPFLDREKSHFMETGEFVPKGGFQKEDFSKSQLVEDDNGNYINRPEINYPKNLQPNYYKDQKKLKLEAKRLKYSLSMKPNVYAADLWASAFKHKTQKDFKIDENKISLDFYEKYHEMAVPRKYPLSMPPPEEDWKNWSRIPEFKKYGEKYYELYGEEKRVKTESKFDPSKKYRGEIMGIAHVQHGRQADPLMKVEFDLEKKKGGGKDYRKIDEETWKDVEYQTHPFDTMEYEEEIDSNYNSKALYIAKGQEK